MKTADTKKVLDECCSGSTTGKQSFVSGKHNDFELSLIQATFNLKLKLKFTQKKFRVDEKAIVENDLMAKQICFSLHKWY